MADVISLRKGLENKERMKYLGKIAQKHFDFVIHDSDTSEILLVIELDDSSHNSKRAQKSDLFKNQACKSAGVPLLRILASNSYSPVQLSALLVEQGLSVQDSLVVTEVDNTSDESELACPKCDSSLVLRNPRQT